jgi:hypothetical protein
VAGVLDPLHFLFPRVRFSLPNRAEPIFATNSTHRIPRSFGIPKIIWQTNYTDRMDTRERAEFKSSTFGAAQADLWRILVLQKFGGVYLDIDAQWDGRWDSSSSPTTKNSTSGIQLDQQLLRAILDNIGRVSSNDVAEVTGAPLRWMRPFSRLNVPKVTISARAARGLSQTSSFSASIIPRANGSRSS